MPAVSGAPRVDVLEQRLVLEEIRQTAVPRMFSERFSV